MELLGEALLFVVAEEETLVVEAKASTMLLCNKVEGEGEGDDDDEGRINGFGWC